MEVIERAPTEVWGLFLRKKRELGATYERIAFNSDIGVEIYLSAEPRGTESFPCITVFQDDNDIYSEVAVNEIDCEQTTKKIFYEYLSEERLINRMAEELDAEDEQAEVDIREEELIGLTLDYISMLMDESIDSLGDDEAFEIAKDVLDHSCEYLYRKHGISARRPMILEDENGEEFFEEYPYDCMEFDDPDNPVYEPDMSQAAK
ncbi:MAG: hypothetical protein IKR30_04765 [Bacteroidales bacterium]|nr:hypothetical protein [Bacteroidales bacterium]